MSQYVESIHRSFFVDGAYARGTRVKMSASTFNTVTVAGPGDVHIGTLEAATFAAGAVAPVILRGYGTRQVVASGAISVNARVYPDAGGKVTGTANGIAVGIALGAASASGDFIEIIDTNPTGQIGKLFVATSTTDTVTNTTVETAFAQTYAIPANVLQVGDRLRIKAALTVTSHNSTDTLNVKLYVGTNVLVASGATNNAANDIVYFDAEVEVRSITAAGTIVATGVYGDGTGGTATAKPFLFQSATLDSTVAETVKLTATWSVANAADIVRLDVFNIDRIAA
jgi:hypothetical protein